MKLPIEFVILFDKYDRRLNQKNLILKFLVEQGYNDEFVEYDELTDFKNIHCNASVIFLDKAEMYTIKTYRYRFKEYNNFRIFSCDEFIRDYISSVQDPGQSITIEQAKKLYNAGGDKKLMALSIFSEEQLKFPYKDGSILVKSAYGDLKSIFIFNSKGHCATSYYICLDMIKKVVTISDELIFAAQGNDLYGIRIASRQEKKLFFDELKRRNIKWDKKKKEGIILNF